MAIIIDYPHFLFESKTIPKKWPFQKLSPMLAKITKIPISEYRPFSPFIFWFKLGTREQNKIMAITGIKMHFFRFLFFL